jgi:Flp pilus assembly protein TadG
MGRQRDDAGAAVVDFALVSVLLLGLFLLVFQVGVALHVRNVLIASAADGARYGANADRTPREGAEQAQRVVAQALGARLAGAVRCEPVEGGTVDGAPVVDIRCTGPVPSLVGDAITLTVHGHALEEAR